MSGDLISREYRTQVRRWFAEIGVCDGGGMGFWTETTESVEVKTQKEAEALRDQWLASGKLIKTAWNEIRPATPYSLFRIRNTWEDCTLPAAAQGKEGENGVMPDRIWAGRVDGYGGWHEGPDIVNRQEYIRADLAREAVNGAAMTEAAAFSAGYEAGERDGKSAAPSRKLVGDAALIARVQELEAMLPRPAPASADLDALVEALRSGEQADMDGCMVKVSRQACEEAADAITALRAQQPQPDQDDPGGQTQAALDVLAERRRQIEVEGWDDIHDDCHDRAELAQAAACYALSGAPVDEAVYIHGQWKDLRDLFWPWDRAWWKPTDRRRDLVKAGALILAEIEQLDRKSAALNPKAEGV